MKNRLQEAMEEEEEDEEDEDEEEGAPADDIQAMFTPQKNSWFHAQQGS